MFVLRAEKEEESYETVDPAPKRMEGKRLENTDAPTTRRALVQLARGDDAGKEACAPELP